MRTMKSRDFDDILLEKVDEAQQNPEELLPPFNNWHENTFFRQE